MTYLFTVSRAKVSPASLHAEATGDGQELRIPVMTAASRRLAPP
jgi:hypothetical protein